MAADVAAVTVGTATLTASTEATFQLTSPGAVVELVHHGDDTEVVYFAVYGAEPAGSLSGGGADDEQVLLVGERLVVNAPRGVTGTWVAVISAGTPTVSVVRLPVGS